MKLTYCVIMLFSLQPSKKSNASAKIISKVCSVRLHKHWMTLFVYEIELNGTFFYFGVFVSLAIGVGHCQTRLLWKFYYNATCKCILSYI